MLESLSCLCIRSKGTRTHCWYFHSFADDLQVNPQQTSSLSPVLSCTYCFIEAGAASFCAAVVPRPGMALRGARVSPGHQWSSGTQEWSLMPQRTAALEGLCSEQHVYFRGWWTDGHTGAGPCEQAPLLSLSPPVKPPAALSSWHRTRLSNDALRWGPCTPGRRRVSERCPPRQDYSFHDTTSTYKSGHHWREL